jgi:hypothetical protein
MFTAHHLSARRADSVLFAPDGLGRALRVNAKPIRGRFASLDRSTLAKECLTRPGHLGGLRG